MTKGDKFFSLMTGTDTENCPVSMDDIVKIGGFTTTVKKVEFLAGGIFSVQTRNASTVSSGKRNFVCYAQLVVRAKGRVVCVKKHSICVHQPVTVKYSSKKNVCGIRYIHSM